MVPTKAVFTEWWERVRPDGLKGEGKEQDERPHVYTACFRGFAIKWSKEMGCYLVGKKGMKSFFNIGKITGLVYS